MSFGKKVIGKILGDRKSKNMKCRFCNEELGEGDSYELIPKHLEKCKSNTMKDVNSKKTEKEKISTMFKKF